MAFIFWVWLWQLLQYDSDVKSDAGKYAGEPLVFREKIYGSLKGVCALILVGMAQSAAGKHIHHQHVPEHLLHT
jgi:hypothetical protein